MKLSRRDVLGGFGAAVMLAAFTPSMIGNEVIVEGYLKPYGLFGKYLFSATPLHCLECFRGDETALMVVDLKGGVASNTKLRLSGILQGFNGKTSPFAYALKDAKLIKNTFV